MLSFRVPETKQVIETSLSPFSWITVRLSCFIVSISLGVFFCVESVSPTPKEFSDRELVLYVKIHPETDQGVK